jgi:hypothetical protein
MFAVSPKVDKVIYALCTEITITYSRGVTMYTFVGPDDIPYALVYYCMKYRVFSHNSLSKFTEEEVIDWLKGLVPDTARFTCLFQQ